MLKLLLLAAMLFCGGSGLNSAKLQIIPGLLNISSPKGPIFNAETCKDSWKYTMKIHKYDLVCSNSGECLNYEQLGYLFYFPPLAFDIKGSFDELSKRLNGKTVWFNLRIEKEGQNDDFYDFNFPIKISWAPVNDLGDDLNESFNLELTSLMPGKQANASLDCSVYLICDNHFRGNKCQKIDCSARQIMPANSGWQQCVGSNQFADTLESHYKMYRNRQSSSALLMYPEDDSSNLIAEAESPDSHDLFKNRTFVMVVVIVLTLIALVESAIIFGYILKSFRRKSIVRR